jgi:EAL domain-containing protein (putative c-di-GMP-specific phosphodiesterase class I)
VNSPADLFNCPECQDGVEEPFPFSMAFQPIMDIHTGGIFAYEALVREPAGESAATVFQRVTEGNKYAFDRHCRTKAITLASKLGLIETGAALSINFMPGAVVNPVTCLRTTLEAAKSLGIPFDRIIFELTETEAVHDPSYILAIVKEYRHQGLRIALDDFGAGHCGMNLLAGLPADIIKLDMALTRRIKERPVALIIVEQMLELTRKLDKKLIAEGVETLEEYEALRGLGIHLMQGYLFAKPAFEQFPQTWMPES